MLGCIVHHEHGNVLIVWHVTLKYIGALIGMTMANPASKYDCRNACTVTAAVHAPSVVVA